MARQSRSKNLTRIQDRLIDELIGISRGVIADGVVDESEAIYLGQWIDNHREIANRWPVNILYARLTEMLKDGILEPEEQKELLETLREITGGTGTYEERSKSTTLPMSHPEPDIQFEGSTFSLTGRFVFGTKRECEEAIEDLGGIVVPAPTTETDYLVIGELGSPDWIHSTFGRSIEKTVEFNEHGHDIAIVSEEHWVNQL